jgi:putative ABC transport system permease protein
MNIVNQLTMRQLRMNKKRTLVTILGTIISAAMITAVATLGLSFMDLMQRQAIANEGEWHVKYPSVNVQQMEAIKADEDTKSMILSRDTGYAMLPESQNRNKPYLFIKELNNEGFDKFPIQLKEGRLPQRADEIVISDAIRTNAKVDYQIGDVLNLTIGKRWLMDESSEPMELSQNSDLARKSETVIEYLTEDMEKTYTVVGIIERPEWEYTWSPGYTVISYIGEEIVQPTEVFNVSVILTKVTNQLFDHANEIATQNGIENVQFNNSLLRYYGVTDDNELKMMLYSLSAIIIVIIMVGSISLIYNAFAISVSERSRYLGMLSSVGATKRQKRNSVFFEGAVIGAISIPVGILSGFIGIGITYLFINPMLKGALGVTEGFRLVVHPSTIITSILISTITILLSTYIPARRASHISAIDAIRQSTDIRVRKRQVRTSKLTRKIFGIEGELGLKNLKRNRGRYKATVFSLIISMVLFLVVSTFTESLKKALILAQDGVNFDIQTIIDTGNKEDNEFLISKITSLENIKAVSKIDTLNANTMIAKENIADYLKEYQEPLSDEKLYYNVNINVLSDEIFLEYCDMIGADYDRLTNSEKPQAIIIDTTKYKDQQQDKYIETKVVKTKLGEELTLTIYDENLEGEVALQPIEIAAQTKELPMGVMSMGGGANFHLILSQASYQLLAEGNEEQVKSQQSTRVFFLSDNALQLQEDLEEIQNDLGVDSLYIYNIYLNHQREGQMVLLLSVFTYAFILLITAICVANILNTVATSISLRKREFAMLKSVGITPKGFNKMLNYESIFYGVKALLYGLPISFVVMYLIHLTMKGNFEFDFQIPFASIVTVVISVFIIVITAMLYSGSKVKKDNIIDALKQEMV